MFAPFQKIDETLLRWINVDLVNPIGDFIFPLFNHPAPFVPLIAVLLFTLIYKNSPRAWLIAGTSIFCLIIGDFFIFNPLKQWISRPRPAADLNFVRTILASGATGGFAFPSSHTANAFLLATVVGCFIKRWRTLFFIAATFIGVSRIYVGVHYPSDVMGSAILGSFVGWGLISGGKHLASSLQTRNSSLFQFQKTLHSIGGPLIFLSTIQLIRIYWIATVPLDPPPHTVTLWNLATSSNTHEFSLWALFGKIWFTLFGSSKISLWLIPWFFQSIFLLLTGLIVLFLGGPRASWIFSLISISVPLFSEISFLATPSLIFEDSDWRSPLQIQASIFYLLLCFPLLIASLWNFRKHRFTFLLTFFGILFAATFPQLPCNFLAIAMMGTTIVLSVQLSNQWTRILREEGRWLRLGCSMIALSGLILTIAVYNPRFLRKLDISLLPRNNPHYIQTGWSECAATLRTAAEKQSVKEIWVDSQAAKNYFQYLLGESYTVKDRENQRSPIHQVIYVQEVYYAQIHPMVIFLPRWIEPKVPLVHPPLFYTEIVRKGDPIRQFRVYPIDP